ncbi:MAG TPA: hypothetical protein VFW02_04930 [Candidatus Limnocylindrales bacterium]|nr:hypothetical protein [Candidatus Limnocylindrales bacterium]
MSALVRRGGTATLPDGDEVVWSVADGRRGRRWRAATIHVGVLTSSMLLEVDVDGRPGRLELTTPAGLLTLHPEATGSLHGNAVTPGGVRHLTFAWSDEHGLEIDGLPIPTAVTAGRLAATIPVGEGTTVPVVGIALDDLTVHAAERRYRRLDRTTWRIEGGGREETLAIDGRGLPVWPGTAGEWPIELEPHP